MDDTSKEIDTQRGFDLDRFVTPPREDLVCPICHAVVNNPQQSPCEHLFCAACIQNWAKTQHTHKRQRRSNATSTNQMQCPVCMTPFHNLTAPHRIVKNWWQELQLRCSFADCGCTETPTVESVLAHEERCGAMPVHCPNQGCGAVNFVRKTLKQHIACCEWRVVQCPNGCDSPQIRARELQAHLTKDCGKQIVACPLQCGETNLQRKDLEEHVSSVCGKRQVECVVRGCRFRGEESKVAQWQKHMADENRLHMMLVMGEISKLQSENEAIKARLQQVENANQELNWIVQQQQEKLNGLGQTQRYSSQQQCEWCSTLDTGKPNISQKQATAQIKNKLAKLNQIVTDAAIQSADFVVSDVVGRWDSGLNEFSQQLSFPHQDPRLRFPFQLQVSVTELKHRRRLSVAFIPRSSENSTQQLRWPITNHIRLSVINTKGGKNKSFILQGEENRYFFAQHCPPKHNNTKGRGWHLLDRGELDSGQFVDPEGRVFIKAEMLSYVFLTQPVHDSLIAIAREKGCDWVIDRVQARWDEGVHEYSPQLTIAHPNPSLQYAYLLLVQVNVEHCNQGHVGLHFIPRVGSQPTRWPIRNHIRITVLSVSQTHEDIVVDWDDAEDERLFSKLGTPPQGNFRDGMGLNEFLNKEEVFGGGYVDSHDRMFLKVEMLDSTFN